MPLPPALDPERTRDLRPAGAADVPVRPPAPRRRPTSARGLARLVADSRPGRRLVAASRAAVRRLLPPEVLESPATVEELRAQVHRVADDRLDEAVVAGRIESVRTNLELLKAEVRGLERTLHELGMAFAPATGLAGVPDRFGELREQVNVVSRRLRQIDHAHHSPVAEADDHPPAATVGTIPAERHQDPRPGGALDELFDYVAFERRFRGTPEEVLATQTERYADLLAAHEPVVDLGCGRGELAELLVARGTTVVGVEPDGGMAAEARARGLDVRATDAATFLRAAQPDSLGAVFSAHVAEHMPFEDLLEIVHLSLDRLRPGGVFVAETPNPASLIVPSNSFILDPTHQRPVHPSLFAFVCETAGFRDVRLTFYSPATGYHLESVDDDSPVARALNANASRLNEVLFGPQEYAVVATKAI